jgi:hypothetical protein
MLYREIIAVCSEIHTKHINTLCGQNLAFFYLKSDGRESNHRDIGDRQRSVGFLWTSDQPDAETSDYTQHSQETDINASGGIRPRIPSKRAAADPRLRLELTELCISSEKGALKEGNH